MSSKLYDTLFTAEVLWTSETLNLNLDLPNNGLVGHHKAKLTIVVVPEGVFEENRFAVRMDIQGDQAGFPTMAISQDDVFSAWRFVRVIQQVAIPITVEVIQQARLLASKVFDFEEIEDIELFYQLDGGLSFQHEPIPQPIINAAMSALKRGLMEPFMFTLEELTASLVITVEMEQLGVLTHEAAIRLDAEREALKEQFWTMLLSFIMFEIVDPSESRIKDARQLMEVTLYLVLERVPPQPVIPVCALAIYLFLGALRDTRIRSLSRHQDIDLLQYALNWVGWFNKNEKMDSTAPTNEEVYLWVLRQQFQVSSGPKIRTLLYGPF